MMATINTMSRGIIYQHLVDNFCMQYYLCKPINTKYQKYITRYRISAHNLNIEQGRYGNIIRNSRVCTLCDKYDIEDEYHFILQCPFYDDFRALYIKKYYYKKPIVFSN